jgi:prepilin-type N-terminal cleavage/methylation domain-containing protein
MSMVPGRNRLGAWRGLGFTLIEMLIVVGIIAILAAIAVPNLLEAQTRSKVARVKSDLRTVAMAIETYRQANNSVPHCIIYCEKHLDTDGLPGKELRGAEWLTRVYALTTPVAFLSTANWVDPFIRARSHRHLADGDTLYRPMVVHPMQTIPEPPTVVTPGEIFVPERESRNPTNSYMYAVFNYLDLYDVSQESGVIKDGFPYYRHEDTEIHRPQYFLISVGPDGMAGPDFVIACDANQAWTPAQALDFCRAVAPLDIRWIEEPVRWHDQLEGLRLVREGSPIPVTAGQGEITRFGCRDLIVHGRVNILNVDVTIAGGVTEWRRIAALAAHFHVKMAHHEESQVALHLLASIPHGLFVEIFADPARDPLWYELPVERPLIRDGYMYLPDRPGLGMDLDESVIARYRADG